MPISFLLFWLVFVPKGTLALHHSFVWMIFPTIYVIYLLLCGPCYAFLDIGVLGFDRVLGNIGLMVVAFLGLGQSLALIDRLRGRSQQSALSNVDATWRSVTVLQPARKPGQLVHRLVVKSCDG